MSRTSRSRLFTVVDPTRGSGDGSGQDVFKISQVRSGREVFKSHGSVGIGSGWVGPGDCQISRFGSGQEVIKILRAGPGHEVIKVSRVGYPDPRALSLPVNSPDLDGLPQRRVVLVPLRCARKVLHLRTFCVNLFGFLSRPCSFGVAGEWG